MAGQAQCATGIAHFKESVISRVMYFMAGWALYFAVYVKQVCCNGATKAGCCY